MTEYKKNDKGIWLPDNTNRQQGDQNEMPNITKNLSKFINYIPKITALFTVIGIVVGNLNIYNYLKHINFDFLFSDIIGNSSSAIAVLLMYSLFMFLLIIGFFSPFLINAFSKILNFDKSLKINYEKLYGVCALNSFCYIIIIFFYLKYNLNFNYYLLMTFLSSFLFRFDRFDCISPKDKSFFVSFFVANMVIYPPFIYLFFVNFLIMPTIGEEFINWLFSFIGAFLFLFNFLIAYLSICHKKYTEIAITISLILIVIYTLFLSSFQDYSISLHKPKFIEKHKNSSWYIIHNGNATSETINGMTKDEIKYRQLSFIPNGWQQYCKDDVFNNINMQNCPTLRNENVLYGYMAWNLGNTKVFCPQSVDFFKTDNQNERNVMSQRCLVIDGKYLQLVSEYYLKQPINQ